MKVISIENEVAVDLGHAVIKGAIKDTNIIRYDKFDNKVKTNRGGNPNEIRFKNATNGAEIIFGAGNLQNNKLKHERELLLEQALIMSSRLVKEDKYKIKLNVALPPTEFFNDEYVNKYKNKFPLGLHKFQVSDENDKFKEKEVYINEVEVHMEGYSAFLNIAANLNTTNNILLFDLGGGTLDVIEIMYDRREKGFFPNNAITVRTGAIDLYSCIAAEINQKGHNVKAEWIETTIDDKEDMVNSRYSIKEHINKATTEFKAMLIEAASKLECSINEYDIICVGGGTNIFNMLYSDTNLIQIDLDTLYANAAGMLV